MLSQMTFENKDTTCIKKFIRYLKFATCKILA